MKLLSLGLILISSFAYSAIKLDLDLYNSSNGKEIQLQKSLKATLDEIQTIKVPNSNRIIELTVSKNMPKSMNFRKNSKNAVLIDMKVFEDVNGDRKLISSPKIITRLDNEATLEEFDTDSSTEKPVLRLKVNPTKIK